VDLKAEYSALYSTRSHKKKLKQTTRHEIALGQWRKLQLLSVGWELTK